MIVVGNDAIETTVTGRTNAITEVGDDIPSTINNITPTTTTTVITMYSAPLSEPFNGHKTVNMTHTTDPTMLSLPNLLLPHASLVAPFTAIATTVTTNTTLDIVVAFSSSYY